ncbi:MAG: hypothetical protein U1F58_09755 [Burkholderiales bacterium]
MSMNPYAASLAWLQRVGPDTGGGIRMTKMILSLYNPERYPFSFGECVVGLDLEGQRLALKMINDYLAQGETEDLRKVGFQLWEASPGIRAIASAMTDARADLLRQWSERNRAAYREEDDRKRQAP